MFGLFKKADPAAAAAERPRDPRWASWLKKFLVGKSCICCDSRENLTGHHDTPFHIDPSRELDPTNVDPVCGDCHFTVAHLRNWRLWNKDFRKHAATLLAARRAAVEAAKEAA